MKPPYLILTVATGAACLAGGYWGATRDSDAPRVAVVTEAVAPAGIGAIPPEPPVLRSLAAAPGSVRTPDGAGRFAARGVERLGVRELLADPGAARVVLEELGGPRLADDVGDRYQQAFAAMASGLEGRPAERVLRVGALGYRVEAWSGRTARVSVWKVTLVGTATRGVVANWDTSHLDLAWRSGRWWVNSFGPDTPGPAPSPTRVGVDTPPAVLAADEADFRRLG